MTAALFALSGCGTADAPVIGAVAATGALARSPTLLIATTRKPEKSGEKPWFTGERGRGLAFAEARIGTPDRSLVGRLAAVVASGWSVDSVGPVKSEGAGRAFADAAMGRDVLLYVHGYRESFETAAVSAAELADGVGFRGAAGVFTALRRRHLRLRARPRERAMVARRARGAARDPRAIGERRPHPHHGS